MKPPLLVSYNGRFWSVSYNRHVSYNGQNVRYRGIGVFPITDFWLSVIGGLVSTGRPVYGD